MEKLKDVNPTELQRDGRLTDNIVANIILGIPPSDLLQNSFCDEITTVSWDNHNIET